uniref:G-protein coupled receptors family 1 profile domain-containing protein n=1 Tax=Ditylenchus dipsaci TaxID=166011 RepID=A0A915CVS0_9BILA
MGEFALPNSFHRSDGSSGLLCPLPIAIFQNEGPIVRIHAGLPVHPHYYVQSERALPCLPSSQLAHPQPSGPTMYEPYLLFWMGMFAVNYMVACPLNVLLLAVDRCLSLKLTINYTRRFRKWVIWVGVAVILGVVMASTYVYLMDLPLDLTKVARCETFTCVLVKYRNLPQLFAKVVFATANVLFSAIFFYLLKKNVQSKVNDRVVKNTILLEIVFDVIPAYSAFCFNMIAGEPSANYVGQFAITACVLDAAFCAVFYSIAMFRLKGRDRGQKSSQQKSYHQNTLNGKVIVVVTKAKTFSQKETS